MCVQVPVGPESVESPEVEFLEAVRLLWFWDTNCPALL